jgi:hypothetical protein
LSGIKLGRSDLEREDTAKGVRRGVFIPSPAYELVEPVFRLYAEAVPDGSAHPADEDKLARYYKARDSLPLELVDGTGRVIPTRVIHIGDFRADSGAEAIELEVTFA